MRRLIYTSQSQLGNNWAELDAIVIQASVSNKAVGITGMLWANEDRFVQVLEGEHDAVSNTLARIRADPRHANLEIVCDRSIIHKMFDTWAMARPDRGQEATAGTAFLIGFVAGERGTSARKAYDLLLKAEM